MSHPAAPTNFTYAISGLGKLAAANSRQDIVANRGGPLSAAADDRAPAPEKLGAANSGSYAAVDKDGAGVADPVGYAPSRKKLAAANSRFSTTSQHGHIPADSVHTAWRRTA